MRRLPAWLRLAITAFAALQVTSGAVSAVVDGLERLHAPTLAAHVDGAGSTHDGRAHPHECLACTVLRVSYVPLNARLPMLALSQRTKTLDCGPSVADQHSERALCARSPPARIG